MKAYAVFCILNWTYFFNLALYKAKHLFTIVNLSIYITNWRLEVISHVAYSISYASIDKYPQMKGHLATQKCSVHPAAA